ncbi:MAG TPA: DUF1232 domain-containing protein [Spirochaetota bacterium]|nr:DUF1232 domain-containing protein [Spirochaetota bacterium]
MKTVERFKQRAAFLKKELLALHFAYKNPATGWLPKLIILITLGYALSPIDLIPDFIPIIGHIDDIIIIPALISLSIKLIPGNVMEEAREKAAETSLQLNKRWFFGILFIAAWFLIVLFMVKFTLNKTGKS